MNGVVLTIILIHAVAYIKPCSLPGETPRNKYKVEADVQLTELRSTDTGVKFSNLFPVPSKSCDHYLAIHKLQRTKVANPPPKL